MTVQAASLDTMMLSQINRQWQAWIWKQVKDPSLLRFMVDLRGADLSDKQLRDDLMTMLIAGHETTAAVLTWALFCLMQNPEAEKKVIDELEKAMPDGEDDNMGKNQSSYEKFQEMMNELKILPFMCSGELSSARHQLIIPLSFASQITYMGPG